ncbi:hypothetical protein HAX54_007086 [Datura stramonium]|uniref:Uncharacterized protein n=1 Tax=Datura stramonium TaxID=4076 RepID=A0ABS8TC33_DATST|nr:hypothetical protein [Datura stramonium]
MANTNQQLSANQDNNDLIPNNEHIFLRPHDQFLIKEQTPNRSGHESVSREEFNMCDAKEQISNDMNKFDDEGCRNDTDSGDMSLEEQIRKLTTQHNEILKLLAQQYRNITLLQ